MKFIQTGEGSFEHVREGSDASEEAVTEAIELIGQLVEAIAKHGHSPKVHAADRAGGVLPLCPGGKVTRYGQSAIGKSLGQY